MENVEGKEVDGVAEEEIEGTFIDMPIENFLYGVGRRQHTQLHNVAGPYKEILTKQNNIA